MDVHYSFLSALNRYNDGLKWVVGLMHARVKQIQEYHRSISQAAICHHVQASLGKFPRESFVYADDEHYLYI
jgi:hypothetical protein